MSQSQATITLLDEAVLKPRPAEFSNAAFAQHVVLLSASNLMALLCSGALAFLLPRWLSIEDYGYYRLFILYGNFVGLLHLGLLDGALIRWAAHSYRRLRRELLHTSLFLLVEHLIMLVPALALVLLFVRQQPWLWLVISLGTYAVIWNGFTLGQYALQASKRFGWLSFVTIVAAALLLLAIVVLEFVGRLSLRSVVIAYLASNLVAAGVGWGALRREVQQSRQSAGRIWKGAYFHIRLGWSVLLANFFTLVALSLDRIFVSFTFSIHDFAIYSFAANALAVVNTIILSISSVVFPYLSNGISGDLRQQAYTWGEALIMVLWALSLATYFPIHLLVSTFLPNYLSSLPILRLLMLPTGMTAIIMILQANYFRAALRQRRLLIGATTGLVVAAMLLSVARWRGELTLMAAVMVAALFLWWLFNEVLLAPVTSRGVTAAVRTGMFMAACATTFVLSAGANDRWVGCLVYLAVSPVLLWLFFSSALRTLPYASLWRTRMIGFGSSQ